MNCSCLTGSLGAVMFLLVFTVSAPIVGNSVWGRINLILNLYSFILYSVNLVNMLTKHKFKSEMFVRSLLELLCVLILRSTVCINC